MAERRDSAGLGRSLGGARKPERCSIGRGGRRDNVRRRDKGYHRVGCGRCREREWEKKCGWLEKVM